MMFGVYSYSFCVSISKNEKTQCNAFFGRNQKLTSSLRAGAPIL